MTFIERKDGTVYDPEFEREKKMEEEQKVKDVVLCQDLVQNKMRGSAS